MRGSGAQHAGRQRRAAAAAAAAAPAAAAAAAGTCSIGGLAAPHGIMQHGTGRGVFLRYPQWAHGTRAATPLRSALAVLVAATAASRHVNIALK